MIITNTIVLTEKNTRTGTSQNGKIYKNASFPFGTFEGKMIYISFFLNDYCEIGDTILVSGKLQQTEKNGKTYFSLKSVAIQNIGKKKSTIKQPNQGYQQPNPGYTTPDGNYAPPMGQGRPVETISDNDFPW